jgi:hypothetical protein
MTFGILAFLNPWLLGALAALPIIYWLLRTVPPRPRRIAFPPTRILLELINREKTPAKTPWWLMLIRMLAATLIILALAEPVLNPNQEKALKGSGPVVIVVDNGWAAAAHFAERMHLVDRLIAEAEGQSRPVLIAQTAPAGKSQTLRIEAPNAARSTAAALQPQPFEPMRAETAAELERALGNESNPSIIWLADGIDHDGAARAFSDRLVALAGSGGVIVIEGRQGDEALGVVAALGPGGKLEARVMRASGGQRAGMALAYSARGQRLGEVPFEMTSGVLSTTTSFELPLELRNQVTRVEIAGERSAGAVHLLDARSRWHRIGLVSGEAREQAQPLLAPLYYIEKALGPFAELVRPKDVNLAAAMSEAFKQNVSILMLADIGTLSGDLLERVDGWVKKGGVLVRFAGPRLEKGGDELIPVGLRIGGRTLGGALSWSTPQPLAPFDEQSLFAGLGISPDVVINRQVLADPGQLTADVRVWARLKDGTPLVTAARKGEGQIVLFHVTANSDWSNLPMSGLFVEMLRRISTLGRTGGVGAGGVETASSASDAPQGGDVLTPIQVLDGFGTLRPPPPTAQPIEATRIDVAKTSLDHPPGYYGTESVPRALNVIGQKTVLRPLPALAGVEQRTLAGDTTQPLKPALLAAALALLFIDIVAIMLLQAGSFWRRGARTAASATGAMLLALLVLDVPQADAQSPGGVRTRDEQMAIQATGKVTFAYVVTGDSGADGVSRAGLIGLGKVLAARTAVEPGEPFGVNIITDEVAFFPILYWPVLNQARPLPDATLAKIDAYMKQGGMIVFDTRDYGQGVPAGLTLQGRGGTPLQRLLGRLDIPRLEPVPEGHVLTKSFYLLRTFPGRWDGGQMWVEAESSDTGAEQGRKARRADGVSSILVTSNDLAAAWALDDRNRPIYPTVPGGEMQREMAYRVGINIVMYALTGNYKADQVHVPALLERLGQ